MQEVKSETLEKLLKALDARHVSGWYHPAMRLQAELHTLEGTNAELREQLRLARLELSKYVNSPRQWDGEKNELENLKILKDNMNSSEIITNLNNHLLTVLNVSSIFLFCHSFIASKVTKIYGNFIFRIIKSKKRQITLYWLK